MFLFRSISIAIRRGNAASILGTPPFGGGLYLEIVMCEY